MLKIENVSYRYSKDAKWVLDDISFEVKPGEIVAIIGKNGSGKSTLGKVISGIYKLKKGKVLKEESKKIGIVFQNPENQLIFPVVEEEFFFLLSKYSKQEQIDKMKEALKKVGMEGFDKKDISSLSLGEKQRIVIGEILSKKPDYIILDEPTTMIDSAGKEEIRKIVEKLKQEGLGIIYITNMDEEILIADKIILIENGKICLSIDKKELFDRAEELQEHGIKLPELLILAKKLKKKNPTLKFSQITVEGILKTLEEGKI